MLGIDLIKNGMRKHFDRKTIATIALCRYYAAKALEEFRRKQPSFQFAEGFWINRTTIARNSVFADSFTDSDAVGFFLAHAVGYGVYLELANNRKHESLRPVIESVMPLFESDLGRLWAR